MHTFTLAGSYLTRKLGCCSSLTDKVKKDYIFEDYNVGNQTVVVTNKLSFCGFDSKWFY